MKYLDTTTGVGTAGALGAIVLDHVSAALGVVIAALTIVHLVFKIRNDIRDAKRK